MSTGRTIGIRTCGRAGQIALLLPLARRLRVGLCMTCGWERLPVCAVHGRRSADTAPDGVCWYKGLSLRRNRREDAVLVESQAVGAAAIFGGLEARAANLCEVSNTLDESAIETYLATSAVAAGNGSALAGRRRLVMLLDILRWGRALLAVRVLRRRGARPLVGAWKTILLLVLRVLVCGHVRARLLGRWRRESGVHLRGQVSRRSDSLWQARGWAGRCEGRCTLLTRDDGTRDCTQLDTVHTLHCRRLDLHARAAADRRRWQAAGSQAAASEGAFGPGHRGEGTWRVVGLVEGCVEAWKRGSVGDGCRKCVESAALQRGAVTPS